MQIKPGVLALASCFVLAACAPHGPDGPTPTPSAESPSAAHSSSPTQTNPSPSASGIAPQTPVASAPPAGAPWAPQITGADLKQAGATRVERHGLSVALPNTCAAQSNTGWICKDASSGAFGRIRIYETTRGADEEFANSKLGEAIDVTVPPERAARAARSAAEEQRWALAVAQSDGTAVMVWEASPELFGPLGFEASFSSVKAA